MNAPANHHGYQSDCWRNSESCFGSTESGSKKNSPRDGSIAKWNAATQSSCEIFAPNKVPTGVDKEQTSVGHASASLP